MKQNQPGRRQCAARRSGRPPGQWSGGHARGGRAERSMHETAGLESLPVRGTVESPTSDPEARPPVLSKQSPDCLTAPMNEV